MKFALIIEYGERDMVKAVASAHRTYLRGLLEGGQLFAAGPLTEDGGALWVLEAETPEQAEEIVRGDPSHAAGAFVKRQVHPLAYWSAKACKGT